MNYLDVRAQPQHLLNTRLITESVTTIAQPKSGILSAQDMLSSSCGQLFTERTYLLNSYDYL